MQGVVSRLNVGESSSRQRQELEQRFRSGVQRVDIDVDMSGDVQDGGQGVDVVDDEIEDVERVDQVDFGVDLVGDLGVDVGMQSGSTV